MQRNADTQYLINRAAELLDRLETLLPTGSKQPDWEAAIAFRWRRSRGGSGYLQPVEHPDVIYTDDLCGIDRQKEALDRNTRQFVRGLPANNVLLSGSKGTGKSSLIKALLQKYAGDGLRVIEVDRQDLVDLPDIVEPLYHRPERFIVFSDDLSFEASDPSYKALKAILDGSISGSPDNVLIYATSNRRHLLPEYMKDNLDAHYVEGEVHQSEAVEEKISLSERFGLWLTFYPFKQADYLDIAFHWVESLAARSGLDSAELAEKHDEIRAEALKWALTRGSRSGRSAFQFARDWVGQLQLGGD